MAIFLLAAAVLFSVAGCASQRDLVTLDTRTYTLERRYAEMEKQYTELEDRLNSLGLTREAKDKSLREQSAELRAGQQRLREDVQTLSGHVDEADYQLRQRMEEVEVRLAQQDARLKKVEQYLDVQSSRKSTPAVAAAPAPTAEESEESRLYARGRELFDAGKYTPAREVFQEVLKKYPKSDQADNAQFWIGETYFREKWYEKAILEYQRVIDDYPQGNKVPAALLKQAMAFEEIGDKDNARLIYKELMAKYPNTAEARVAAEKTK